MYHNYYKFTCLIGLVLTSIFYLGCSNDFEVNAPAKDIPVVFGLLSKSDDYHLVRVERAFLEPGEDALDLARQESQLYYPADVTVSLKNISTGTEFILERINAVDLGFVREAGIFLEDPNILYGVSADQLGLDEGSQYELKIVRGNGLADVTANTAIVGDMKLTRPIPVDVGARSMSILPNKDIRVSLSEDPVNGVLFDVILTIDYQERTTSDTEFKIKTIEWPMVVESSTAKNLTIFGLEFYSFISGAVGETEPGTIRRMSSISIKVVAGGQTFVDFQRVLRANSGITGAEDAIPNFSNLSEGRGLFSSRNLLIEENFFLTGESLDSMRTNALTRDLNFVL